MPMGIIVDNLQEVYDILTFDIELPPQFEAFNENNLILGMGKINAEVKRLLDIDKVLTSVELVNAKQTVEV